MKKKINVTFQVQYETEIEVDTDLPEAVYELSSQMLINAYGDDDVVVNITNDLHEQIQDIIESKEIANIEIPMATNGRNFYRKNSFEVVNIIV